MSMLTNSEVKFLRVIANATPVVHPILGSIPNKGCFPLPDTKTGTIDSDPTSTGAENKKVVFGTGTLFTSEVRAGDYLYAADALRLIEYVTSDTQLILRSPFPSAVSAADVKVVRSGKYKVVLAKNTGPVNAIYEEAKFEIADVSARENERGLAPCSYDCSAATAEITFELGE